MALAFTARHARDLRYVAAWDRWMQFRNGCWQHENTLLVFDRARALCREAAGRHKTFATQLTSARTVAAVERLAKTDRRIAATVDQWDADPWQLNTPKGVVELRTGDVRPAFPEDLHHEAYRRAAFAQSKAGKLSTFSQSDSGYGQ